MYSKWIQNDKIFYLLTPNQPYTAGRKKNADTLRVVLAVKRFLFTRNAIVEPGSILQREVIQRTFWLTSNYAGNPPSFRIKRFVNTL